MFHAMLIATSIVFTCVILIKAWNHLVMHSQVQTYDTNIPPVKVGQSIHIVWYKTVKFQASYTYSTAEKRMLNGIRMGFYYAQDGEPHG